MNSVRYIGMDVHRDTISVAVLDESGRLMMESVLQARAAAILDFIHGVRCTLHVTCKEGTHSAWLYDLLMRRVAKLVVCNPRKNALLKSGSKSDAIDARKLAELLRAGMLSAVYHGETGASSWSRCWSGENALSSVPPDSAWCSRPAASSRDARPSGGLLSAPRSSQNRQDRKRPGESLLTALRRRTAPSAGPRGVTAVSRDRRLRTRAALVTY